jgi:hypothetical protein
MGCCDRAVVALPVQGVSFGRCTRHSITSGASFSRPMGVKYSESWDSNPPLDCPLEKSLEMLQGRYPLLLCYSDNLHPACWVAEL